VKSESASAPEMEADWSVQKVLKLVQSFSQVNITQAVAVLQLRV
jgi:hypothetical protein